MFTITLKFLEAVKINNNTERMHANWDLYQQEKKRFENFIQLFLEKIKKLNPDLEDLKTKDCIFRFNKDLRFSKDGNPYKHNFGAVFTFGGKKSDFPCFYFHLEPGKSFIGGGVYMPSKKHEENIRKLLLQKYHIREQLLSKPKFKKFFSLVEAPHLYKSTQKLKQIIKGNPDIISKLSPILMNYDIKNNTCGSSKKDENLLNQIAYFRDRICNHPMNDEEICDENLMNQLVEAYRLMLPILRFFEEAYQ